VVTDFRDLWAGNPYFDHGGRLLHALEGRVLRRSAKIVATTPEAVAHLRAQHTSLADRVVEVPNGFEPELLSMRDWHSSSATSQRTTIVHSGALMPERPLAPLMRALAREPFRSAFCLVLHGYVAPEIGREISQLDDRCELVQIPPSSWREAVERIAAADVTLVTQADAAGDQTAVAGKVYEYLALGKPVLCLSDGGATEALLRRLGAARYCARLDDEASIVAALQRLLQEPRPEPVAARALEAYDRSRIVGQMAKLLDALAARQS
jgi:glycosyltransferase involved in cell wall biosynthesis